MYIDPRNPDTEIIYLRGGSMDSRRKTNVPLNAKSVSYEDEAPGETYYRTDEDMGGETIFEYRAG